jgi:hypothetical protein
MADPSALATPRLGPPVRPAIPARWGFWKGLLTGAVIEIPAIAATVWGLARLGIGDPSVELMPLVRLTAVFTGIAALLTAGGIGRLAAHAGATGGRRRAAFVAARAHAFASAGLVLIATIPHGNLPAEPLGFLPIALAGLVPGLVCGALIGVVCGGAAPDVLSEMWSLARRPSDALRQLLGPDDLAKLGSTLRVRTSTLLEGMFDPAPPPPSTPPTSGDAQPSPSPSSSPSSSSTAPSRPSQDTDAA